VRPLVLAALASIPSRAHLLPRVLESLRPQVDRLHVYLNGYDSVPESVGEFADNYVLDPTNKGAERKLHWSSSHTGVYLSCDDDFCYLRGYVATMLDAVARWDGRAIVSAHGRTYLGQPAGWHNVAPKSIGNIHKDVPSGRWINHGGSGVMAWDTRIVPVPSEFPESNLVDAQIATWAQRARVPMWLVPHPARWLHALAYLDAKGIFKQSQRDGHKRRSEIIRRHGVEHGWQLYELT
jgi:hypothetical protein